MMKWWFRKPSIMIGVGVVGVGVVSCFVRVLRQQKDEIIRTEAVNRVTRTIRIPQGYVGHVLGRGGTTIKSIRERSKARITFDDSENEFTVATLSGTPEAVERAAELINEILSNRNETVTREITLDEGAADSVWRSVHCIRQICDASRAKMQFDFLPERGGGRSPVRVVVKGRREEVESAVARLDELVARAVERESGGRTHVAGRALPANLPLPPNTQSLPFERLVPSSADHFVETYVSAVSSPSKFWVQISGSLSAQLDKLATEMTEFYAENRERLRLGGGIAADSVVAAFFEGDSCWYRARVTGSPSPEGVSVFYLDFGDCSILDASLVCALRPEFLSTIPFQAIECSLTGVAPPSGEEAWPEAAVECFREMVHAAEWKVVMTKPVEQRSSEGGGVTYSVQVFDTSTDQDVDIAGELVRRGFAREVV